MENQPLVSVVVPVFNAEKHLKNCVNSICSQSYRNLEILLVDDGSVDNSLALCHSLAKCDKRIKVFDQPNSGAASARNKGLDETVGDCVLFVDSDDTISPTHIEALMDYAQEDIVSTSFVQNWANEINVYSDRESYGYGREAVLEYYGALDPLACGSSCNKLFHKDIIDNYSLRFLTHQSDVGEDHIFVWSYLLHCRSYRNIDNRSYIIISRIHLLSLIRWLRTLLKNILLGAYHYSATSLALCSQLETLVIWNIYYSPTMPISVTQWCETLTYTIILVAKSVLKS